MAERGQTLARVRAICLGLPETSERLSHGAPTFFVRGKRPFVMVLTNHHGDGRFAIWCAAPEGMQSMLVDDRDRPEPLHVRHPVPPRDDEPEREAVLRRQRLSVHCVREQHLVPQGVLDREAPLVVVLHVTLDTAIEAGEDDLPRALG